MGFSYEARVLNEGCNHATPQLTVSGGALVRREGGREGGREGRAIGTLRHTIMTIDAHLLTLIFLPTHPSKLQIGCSAGFLNSVKIKGSHTAMKVSLPSSSPSLPPSLPPSLHPLSK